MFASSIKQIMKYLSLIYSRNSTETVELVFTEEKGR